jgi:hypothetical protein
MEGKSQEVAALVRAYDGNIERQLRESGDKSASQNLRDDVFRRTDTLAHMQLGLNTLKSSLGENILKPNFGRNDFPRKEVTRQDAVRDTQSAQSGHNIGRDTQAGPNPGPDAQNSGRDLRQTAHQATERTAKLSAQQAEIVKPDYSKPDIVTRTLGNWQADSRGQFVTADRNGRLLTLDENGNKIDYQTHLAQAKSSERTQMTLGSLLFCSPLMMIGMGAAFSFMDHVNGKNGIDQLRAKLEGPKKPQTIKAYSPEMTKLAALTIYQDTRFSPLNNLAGQSAMRAKDEADKSKKKLEQNKRVTPHKVSMAPDSLTTQNMLKQKRRIENLLERLEGRASLAEIARLHSQLETLDRALNRLGNLSM